MLANRLPDSRAEPRRGEINAMRRWGDRKPDGRMVEFHGIVEEGRSSL
jgi:hypothetical protein